MFDLLPNTRFRLEEIMILFFLSLIVGMLITQSMEETPCRAHCVYTEIKFDYKAITTPEGYTIYDLNRGVKVDKRDD